MENETQLSFSLDDPESIQKAFQCIADKASMGGQVADILYCLCGVVQQSTEPTFLTQDHLRLALEHSIVFRKNPVADWCLKFLNGEVKGTAKPHLSLVVNNPKGDKSES